MLSDVGAYLHKFQFYHKWKTQTVYFLSVINVILSVGIQFSSAIIELGLI